MCGLALALSESRIKEMLNSLWHRGPDEVNVVKRGTVHMGHARLAIVDIKDPQATQPYVERNDFVAMFNGEIFNYKDLNIGSEVKTLGQLVFDGLDLSRYLNGYYAGIVYDTARARILVTRDIFGVMPLYYTQHPFEIASEKKALVGKDIYEVPPNSCLIFSPKGKLLKRIVRSLPFRLSKASETQVCSKLFDAVERTATHSDCGFSIAYSGGLDSSMLLAILQKLDLKPQSILTATHTFGDETKRAIGFVNSLGWSSIHKILPVENLEIRPWIETDPNPIRDFAFQRHAVVAKHSPTKVILCGEGADELGLGYPQNRDTSTVIQRYKLKLSWLKSQSAMTLDRVNKAGMMFSKEYRVPFLDIDFVQSALGLVDNNQKSSFKNIAKYHLNLPDTLVSAPKYSSEEDSGRSALWK